MTMDATVNAGWIEEAKMLVKGRLYRGVFIYEDAFGFSILGEQDQQFEFASLNEAEGFVDACWAAQFAAWRTIGIPQ